MLHNFLYPLVSLGGHLFPYRQTANKEAKRRTKDGKENAGKPKKQKTGRGINAIIHCVHVVTILERGPASV